MNNVRPQLFGMLAGPFMAADARARAGQMAKRGGRAVVGLNDGQMEVFQITPRHEVRTSREGVNDTSSPDKTITAVVSATFALK